MDDQQDDQTPGAETPPSVGRMQEPAEVGGAGRHRQSAMDIDPRHIGPVILTITAVTGLAYFGLSVCLVIHLLKVGFDLKAMILFGGFTVALLAPLWVYIGVKLWATKDSLTVE